MEVKDKPDSTSEFRVSDGGKTVTIVSKTVKPAVTFTSVWAKNKNSGGLDGGRIYTKGILMKGDEGLRHELFER